MRIRHIIICVTLAAVMGGSYAFAEPPAADPDETIIVRTAQIHTKRFLRAPGRTKFNSALVDPQPQWDRVWVVRGMLTTMDSVGDPIDKPYLSTVQNICDAYMDWNCWRLVKLYIGDRTLVNIDLDTGPESTDTSDPMAQFWTAVEGLQAALIFGSERIFRSDPAESRPEK